MSIKGTEAIGHAVVTGGAGAIGSRLVRRLLELGAERVVVVDDLSSGFEWLVSTDPRVTFRRLDVCNLLDANLEVERPLVFHLAAFFANQNSVDHPRADLHTNGDGTLTTLMWSERLRARRVVYASAGCSIAGHGHDGAIREDMPVSLHLDTPYQITKALGEFYCNYFNSRVPTVRCRFFNSFGPGEVPGSYRNVIPNFIWKALHDAPLTITGTGTETRDFIYVDDLVEGLVLSALRPAAVGEAINLGTGVQTTVQWLAETIIRECGSKSKIEYAARRSWDRSTHREADISRAKRLLELSPKGDVLSGLRATIGWFHENREQIAAASSGTRSAP
ncbi:MAG: NAD-dependent epimerase/dehydratase family protein [Polyangiaceae bacterium]